VKQRPNNAPAPGLRPEIAIVLGLFGLVAIAMLVTYSRLPASELYHVSEGGLKGGASRVLVFSNFSAALVCLAVLALVYPALERRVERATALLAGGFCCAVFWPGVVAQADLDARPVNALAGIGVVLTIVLSAAIFARSGLAAARREPGDLARLVVGALIALASIPWMAAELGFFLDGVPVLGWFFQTGHAVHQLPGDPAALPAVHHGHHHGMDGFLLVLSALLLSRGLRLLQAPLVRTLVSVYLALMFCYGMGNILNDVWGEQVVKRGWIEWQVPTVLEPRATGAWGVIVFATVLVWTLSAWWSRRSSAVSWKRSSARA
jgi:hypothetical protein